MIQFWDEFLHKISDLFYMAIHYLFFFYWQKYKELLNNMYKQGWNNKHSWTDL